MPILFRVDASVRSEGSHSRAVADTAMQAWRELHPGGRVMRRDLGASPLPSEAWALAVAARQVPGEERTPAQREAVALAATLADEMIEADSLILASPLYNFGVSQFTKVWIDLLITDPRLGPGSKVLAGKPALLVVAQGGRYLEGAPRHGWDHATAYLERILQDTFGMELKTVIADLTLAGSNPSMAHLVDEAAAALADAHEAAARHGEVMAQLNAAA